MVLTHKGGVYYPKAFLTPRETFLKRYTINTGLYQGWIGLKCPVPDLMNLKGGVK
jgi:hypothetical protein